MPRFSAHIGYLFADLPLAGRFSAARAAGFGAVEHPDPYAFGVARFANAAVASGLQVAQIAAPPGETATGGKGLACLPGRTEEFRASVEQGIGSAGRLGAPLLHVMAGILPEGATRGQCRNIYLENIAWAADRAIEAGLMLVIEPISDETVSGFYLNDSRFAAEIIAELGHPSVRMLFDTFHAAVKGIEPVPFLERHMEIVAHVHVADHPGRHEPGTGKIDFGRLFRSLDYLGYEGWIGCEYKPCGMTGEGLGWLRQVTA